MRRMTAQKVDLGVGRNLGDDLSEFRDLRLIPDWPHIRKLVAKRLGRSEDEIQDMAEQAMAKSDSLLDPCGVGDGNRRGLRDSYRRIPAKLT